MGFIYSGALLASFCFIALPGGVLAFLLWRSAERRATFWLTVVGAMAIALPLRLYLVFLPYLETEKVPLWSGRFTMILGVPLFATVLLSGLGLLAIRMDKSCFRECVLGLGTGLGVSLPLQVIFATVWFTELARLAGLRIAY